MKRILLTVLFSLITPVCSLAQGLPDAPTPKVQVDPGPAHTNPGAIKDPYWVDHKVATKHYWEMFSLMAASPVASLKGGLICRANNGVEPCTAHYGAFYQTEVAKGAISVATGTAIYHMCRKDTHNSKWCDLAPIAVIGLNVGWGVHEARINKPDRN